MSRKRIYIQPFKPDGTYAAWIDVTKDVDASKLGSITQALDVSDYDVGVYTNSAVGLTLLNNRGLYSDIANAGTIFAYKRADSQVKITWDLSNHDYFAGVSKSDDVQGVEVVVYQGLLNDDGTVMQLTGQDITFQVLGYDSIFDKTLAPAWSTSAPPAANDAQTLLKSLLTSANAQTTQPLLTLDLTQINPQNNVVWDDLTVFDNKTCREALNTLLEGSNSVLYLQLTTPIVSARTASVSVLKNFYGPGSSLGPENIVDIQDIRTGLNRTFNYLTWTNAATLSTDGGSTSQYGIRKKDLGIDGITNGAKRQGILDAIRAEFAFPKQELTLITPITYDTLALPLLAQVAIDFPPVPVASEILAVYGSAQYGIAQYPVNVSAFIILLIDTFKVIGMAVDLVANTVTFNLRRV